MYRFEAKLIDMDTGDESYVPIEIEEAPLNAIHSVCSGCDSFLMAWQCAVAKAYGACEPFQSLDTIRFICC